MMWPLDSFSIILIKDLLVEGPFSEVEIPLFVIKYEIVIHVLELSS